MIIYISADCFNHKVTTHSKDFKFCNCLHDKNVKFNFLELKDKYV